METNFYAMGEWIKYHALFFNREKAVQEVTDSSRERWLCHSDNNDLKVKRKVLLLDYFNTSYPEYRTMKGWEIKACTMCPDGSDPVMQLGAEGQSCSLSRSVLARMVRGKSPSRAPLIGGAR